MRIERTRNTIRNIKWGYIYRVINIIFPFIFRTVMIQVLGSTYLGLSSLFTAVLQVLSLTELGFGTAMVYSMYRPIADNNHRKICALLRYYKSVYLCIGSLILCLGCIILPFITRFISGGYPNDINIHLVYFLFLVNTSLSYFMFAYKGSLLNAFQRNDVESKILVVLTLFRYTFEILGIVLTKNYYAFLIIEILSTIFLNILKYYYTNRLYPDYVPDGDISNDDRVNIKRNVIALMCHKIGGIALASISSIVIAYFIGVACVADYMNYYYIINAVTGMVLVCFTSMTAGIGNSFVTENQTKIQEFFKKVLFFNAWIVGWCSVCLVCLCQWFIEIWVGKQYLFDNATMLLFVVYFYIHCIRRTIITFRDGAGLWKDNQWQPIVAAFINLILCTFLVKHVGVSGALFASIISMVMVDIPWESISFCKSIGLKTRTYIEYVFRYFIITSVVSIITYKICNIVIVNPLINLIIGCFICLTVPNILFYLVFHNKKEFWYFNDLIKRNVIKKF